MEKTYIDKLKKHLNLFDYKLEDFNDLEKVNYITLNTNNDYSARMTPLLSQIASYGLIEAMFDEEEFDTIERCFYNENTYESIQEVAAYSFDLMLDGIDNVCTHPTIQMYKDLIDGNSACDEMVKILTAYIDNVDDSNRDDILNLFNSIEIYLVDEKIRVFEKTINEISRLEDPKEIIEVLTRMAKVRAYHNMLLGSYTTYYEDNIIIKASLKTRADYYNDTLAKLLKKVNCCKNDYNCDQTFIKETLEYLEKEYLLYKCYQNDYLKNSYLQGNMLMKCKKM